MVGTCAVATTNISTLALVETVAKLMEIGENGLLGHLVEVTVPCPEPELATIRVLLMEDQVVRVTTSTLFHALVEIVQK